MKSRHPVKRRFDDFESEALYYEEGAILEFTEQLAEALQQQNLKRSELAKRLGCSKPYITQVFQGTTNFSFRTAVRLALALGKKFRSALEDHSELKFCVSPVELNAKAAEGEAAVSSTHLLRWVFERAAIS